MHNITNKTIKR